MLCGDEVDSLKCYSIFSKSRSSEDMTLNSSNPEMQNISLDRFLRQKPIHKMTAKYNNEKRYSTSNILLDINSDQDAFDPNINKRRPSAVNENIGPKYHKNSVITMVKDVWKSFKMDDRDNELEIGGQSKLTKLRHSEKKGIFLEDNTTSITTLVNEVGVSLVQSKNPLNLISEASWTDIVVSFQELTKLECDLQAAIWELISTEASYLNFLWINKEIFIPVFLLLQRKFDVVSNINIFHLFGNVEEIYKSNMELWDTCISLPLLKSRNTKEPLDILLMKQGLLSISSTMNSYKLFMQVQATMTKRIQELEKSNSVFKEYYKWTCGYSKSYRDGILSIISVPYQRITRYKLLLDRIKSFTPEDNKYQLDQMVSSVHNFIDCINSMVTGDKHPLEIRSKLAMKPLSKCDHIDLLRCFPENLVIFDITKSLPGLPERVLIHDGQLKIRINNNKRIDVQCYLFDDLFLICKPIRKDWNKLEILKSPIRIDKFIIKKEAEGSFLSLIFNDFATIEMVMMFFGDNTEIKLWIDKVNKTRSLFQTKYQSALKIPNMFLSPNFQSKEINDEREDQVLDNTSMKKVRKKYSESSALSFSTSSTDSFSSLVPSEIANYCQLLNLKSIDSQLTDRQRSLSLEGILQNDEYGSNTIDNTYFLDYYEDDEGKKNRLIF